VAQRTWLIKNAQGSTFLGALLLTSVATVLGVALFQVTVTEMRDLLWTTAEQQAFETAEAGLARAELQLYLDACRSAACDDPASDPSWADGTINGQSFTVTTGSFGAFPNLTDQIYAGGSYSVQLMNLTQTEANAIGQVCSADGSICKDLIYVRATGTSSASTGTVTRTVQKLVRLAAIGGFRGGVISGGCEKITGNTLIAGEFHIPDCSQSPCFYASGTAGVRNNYNDMPGALQDRVPPLDVVTCPAGTLCAGQEVESLGASVRICRDPSATEGLAVALDGTGTLGQSEIKTNSYTSKKGKPTMEAVRLEDGCDNADCSDDAGGNQGAKNVYSDASIAPCAAEDYGAFPLLDDPQKIFGVSYDMYANCPNAGTCICPAGSGCANNSGQPANSSGADFYISHAFKIVSTTVEDSWGCPTGSCTRNLYNILTGTGGQKWDDDTSAFTKTFVCGTDAVCDDSNGKRVNGSVDGSKPPAFQIEWTNSGTAPYTKRLTVFQCPETATTTSDAPTCAAPTVTCRDAGGNAVACTPEPPALAGNVTAGVHRWKYTFVIGGAESSVASGASNYLTVPAGGRQVLLTGVRPGPAGTTARRIYRTVAGNTSDYRFVAEISNNTEVTFTDNVADASLVAAGPRGVFSHTTKPVHPVLIYVDGDLQICVGCNKPQGEFYYQGHVNFLARGTIRAAPDWLTVCSDAQLTPVTCNDTSAEPNDYTSFIQKNFLSFLSPGEIEVSLTSQRDIMAFFYAGVKWTSSKQTVLVGAVSAKECVMNNVPKFFQSPQASKHIPDTMHPKRGPGYTVRGMTWKECQGTLPSGAC